MACCSGQVSWYHCYPQHCPSSDYCCCDYPCTGCSPSCGDPLGTCPCSGCTLTCGKGACCTCNEQQSGFAWVSSAANCFWNVACGQVLYFMSESPTPCGTTAAGVRMDTNGTPSRFADLTPALFMALGHSTAEGVFDVVVGDSGYNCPC